MKLIKIKQLVLLISLTVLTSIILIGCTSQETPSAGGTKSTDNSGYGSYTFTSQEKLVSDTAFLNEDLGYNPHDSHYGTLSCALCHDRGENGGSELWCTSCHIGMKLPAEGWSAYPISAAPVIEGK